MLSVEEALDKILARFNILSSENVSILNSLGQVLSKDVFSSIDVPPADNSAMDGYAVKSKDTAKASKTNPVILKVCGSVSAGESFSNSINSGQALGAASAARLEELDDDDDEL